MTMTAHFEADHPMDDSLAYRLRLQAEAYDMIADLADKQVDMARMAREKAWALRVRANLIEQGAEA